MSQVKPTPAPTLPAYDEGRKAQLEVRATAQEEDYSGFGEIDPYLQETPGDPCGHHFYNPETFDPDKQQRFENEMQKLVTVVNFEESNLTLMEIQSDFEMQRLEIADCRQKILVKYRSFIWS